MKDMARRMGDLRIGQEVTRISLDMGVPDSKAVICGLDFNPLNGNHNITLAEFDGENCYREDGLTLEDIRI